MRSRSSSSSIPGATSRRTRATSSWRSRGRRLARRAGRGLAGALRLGSFARACGDHARSLRLLARRGVRMQRATGGRAVDEHLQLLVLAVDQRGVAAVDRRLEPAEVGLDRRLVAQVLEPLPGGHLDALLLLLDVRHEHRTVAGSGFPRLRMPGYVALTEPCAMILPERVSTAVMVPRRPRSASESLIFATGFRVADFRIVLLPL